MPQTHDKLVSKPTALREDGPIRPPIDAPAVDHTPRTGEPLPPTSRRFFERRFSHDFSQVRVHIGQEAAHAANSLAARAYTIGEDIVFGRAQYRPDTVAGSALLAHELAHVAQSRAADASARALSKPEDGAEQYARRAAVALSWGGLQARYGDIAGHVHLHDDALAKVNEEIDSFKRQADALRAKQERMEKIQTLIEVLDFIRKLRGRGGGMPRLKPRGKGPAPKPRKPVPKGQRKQSLRNGVGVEFFEFMPCVKD